MATNNSKMGVPMPHLPPTALSYGPENGLYPKLDNQSYLGPTVHPPHQGHHPGGPQPPAIGMIHQPNIPSHIPPNVGMVPPPHTSVGMPLPPSNISSGCSNPSYPDSAHAPFPTHPKSDQHGHHSFTDSHGILSKRDLRKISKAEHKMEKEIYKAQKRAEKKAYKAQKKALKKQGHCSSCNHKGSCSCSSSSSD